MASQVGRKRLGSAGLPAIFAASTAVLAAALLASFRLGFAEDAELLLAANGARVLLGAAAGAALGLAGSLRQTTGGEHPLRELSVLALSVGSASGGFIAVRALPTVPMALAFALGATLGAGLLLLIVRGLDRPQRWTNFAVVALLLALFAGLALTGAYSRGEDRTLASWIGWLQGDLGTATWGSAALVAGLASGLFVLSWRSLTAGTRERTRTLGLLALGLGFGAAGILAFVGSMVPRTVRALAPGASARATVAASTAACAASVVAIDAVPRLLVGGYTLAWNGAATLLALPIFALWNRARLRREAGRMHPVQEVLELLFIATATLAVAVFAGGVAALIHDAT